MHRKNEKKKNQDALNRVNPLKHLHSHRTAVYSKQQQHITLLHNGNNKYCFVRYNPTRTTSRQRRTHPATHSSAPGPNTTTTTATTTNAPAIFSGTAQLACTVRNAVTADSGSGSSPLLSSSHLSQEFTLPDFVHGLTQYFSAGGEDKREHAAPEVTGGEGGAVRQTLGNRGEGGGAE